MSDADSETFLVQQPRHHKTIAAIVAGRTHGDGTGLKRATIASSPRGPHSPSGSRRHAMRHRKGVRLAHFRSGEDFVLIVCEILLQPRQRLLNQRLLLAEGEAHKISAYRS